MEYDDVYRYGFYVEFDRVRNLFGVLDYEIVDFVVSFDFRGVNLLLGFIEIVVLINVSSF